MKEGERTGYTLLVVDGKNWRAYIDTVIAGGSSLHWNLAQCWFRKAFTFKNKRRLLEFKN